MLVARWDYMWYLRKGNLNSKLQQVITHCTTHRSGLAQLAPASKGAGHCYNAYSGWLSSGSHSAPCLWWPNWPKQLPRVGFSTQLADVIFWHTYTHTNVGLWWVVACMNLCRITCIFWTWRKLVLEPSDSWVSRGFLIRSWTASHMGSESPLQSFFPIRDLRFSKRNSCSFLFFWVIGNYCKVTNFRTVLIFVLSYFW